MKNKEEDFINILDVITKITVYGYLWIIFNIGNIILCFYMLNEYGHIEWTITILTAVMGFLGLWANLEFDEILGKSDAMKNKHKQFGKEHLIIFIIMGLLYEVIRIIEKSYYLK